MPSKLKIQAYKKPDFSGSAGSYVAKVNPDKLTESYTTKYAEKPAVGNKTTSLEYRHGAPQTLKFDLLFDATGAIPGSPTDLASELKSFKSIVYEYQGSIHEPYYLKITWGKLLFGAKLTQMSVNYTLFTPSGAPLRAKVSVSFKQFTDPETIARQEKNASPDVTHLVSVKSGEDLPMLCDRIYGDTKYYLQVARANKLTHFRDLKPGIELTFPPLA